MSVIKVDELRGVESLVAFSAMNSLLILLKQSPSYAHIPYEQFYEHFKELDDSGKEVLIREALAFNPPNTYEVESIVIFCRDSNGIPYSKSSIKKMPLKDLFEIIVAVCLEIGRLKVDILTDEEKKKYQTSLST